MSKLSDALDARLVSDWRDCTKWLSMRLAALMAALAMFLSEYPSVLISTAQMWLQLPDNVRTLLGPVVGVALLLLIAAARLWQQNHPTTTPPVATPGAAA